MVYSLQSTGTSKEIIIMVTPQVSPRSQTQLAKTGARVIEVEPIPNPCTDANPTAGWINSGYTKLHIWNLTQFSKIVYVDADTVVVENIDEVRHTTSRITC